AMPAVVERPPPAVPPSPPPPPRTVVPSMPLPDKSGLHLDEIEAALAPRATPGVDVAARSLDEPVEAESTSGVWASSSPDEDHPHTLVPGIFGLAEPEAQPTAELVLEEDDGKSGVYLDLVGDDELLSGDIDVEAHTTTSVDTGEMSVDRSSFPPIPLFS